MVSCICSGLLTLECDIGIWVLLIVYVFAFYLTFVSEHLNLSVIHDRWLSCLTASIALSAALSVYLYYRSFNHNALLSKGGQTGYQW